MAGVQKYRKSELQTLKLIGKSIYTEGLSRCIHLHRPHVLTAVKLRSSESFFYLFPKLSQLCFLQGVKNISFFPSYRSSTNVHGFAQFYKKITSDKNLSLQLFF